MSFIKFVKVSSSPTTMTNVSSYKMHYNDVVFYENRRSFFYVFIKKRIFMGEDSRRFGVSSFFTSVLSRFIPRRLWFRSCYYDLLKPLLSFPLSFLYFELCVETRWTKNKITKKFLSESIFYGCVCKIISLTDVKKPVL